MLRRRLVLLVPLLAMFAFVAAVEERAGAADGAEGETFDPTTGTRVVNDTMYSGGQALKFTANVTASKKDVTFATQGNIVLMARGGQSGGEATLSVKVDDGSFSTAKPITNNGAPVAYTYGNVSAGTHTISVRADNTGTGRNPFLDYVTLTGSGGGGTPTTDTDGDGVPDSTDQCPTKAGPASNNGCPTTTTPPAWNCTGTHINRGDDIDAIINKRPRGATTFCVHAGEYQVSEVARLKDGDTLDGEPGTWDDVGPATKPTPVVFLKGGGTDTLLSALGTNISITWVDVSGARGTGRGAGAIAAGSADSTFLVQYSRIHNNDCLGISNAKGQIVESEFFSNSEAKTCIGVNGSAIKGITQFEADRLFVHGEQGNGIWCDVGCKDAAGDFYVHDSVIVGSGRAGIRYENSPTKAVIENNWVHGNGATESRGGIDIRDSQNALVTGNVFGDATIDGKYYPFNRDKIAVRATDSGRTDRVNLSNVDIVDNVMDTEVIKGCELPDTIVACSNNR